MTMQCRNPALLAATLLAVAVPLLGCAQGASGPAAAPPRAGSGAIVKLVSEAGQPRGQAVLTAVPEGVEIVVHAEGLTPGLHGLHIHTNGKCEPGPDPSGKTIAFGAAGGHFDPDATGRHGHPEHDAQRHAGDVPNLLVDGQGKGSLRFTNPRITLQAGGKTSVLGRTLVVHAEADDYKTDPAGNSGGRVLCGVIEPARLDAVVGSVPSSRHLR
ncbi:superoxide dismutase family protein [Pseudorhodoferax sp.]|uniref:superoxide dismutase family protein n=1 Tax=Pseudorhodoferax sp. TaxID=1993553 RepID=UPI002DD62505|nr:superoxide dismutase family protein [Pseudorhodoferax sp.]